MRALVREYTARVADQEWVAMRRQESDPKADDLLMALRSELVALPGGTEQADVAREQAMQAARVVTDERRARVDRATGDDDLLYVLLLGTVIGAVLMVAYPLLIGFTANLRHVLCLALMTGVLALSVYFAVELDQPYHGLITVEPDAFLTALAEYERIPSP